MTDGARLADAAANLIGVPFRLHGRDPRFGLDCVGLIAWSLACIGRNFAAPTAYRLRNTSIGHLLGFAERSGLLPAIGEGLSGDVRLSAPGPGQQHLSIIEDSGMVIHAHAGLRRVVRQPINPSVTVLAQWRLADPPKGK